MMVDKQHGAPTDEAVKQLEYQFQDFIVDTAKKFDKMDERQNVFETKMLDLAESTKQMQEMILMQLSLNKTQGSVASTSSPAMMSFGAFAMESGQSSVAGNYHSNTSTPSQTTTGTTTSNVSHTPSSFPLNQPFPMNPIFSSSQIHTPLSSHPLNPSAVAFTSPSTALFVSLGQSSSSPSCQPLNSPVTAYRPTNNFYLTNPLYETNQIQVPSSYGQYYSQGPVVPFGPFNQPAIGWSNHTSNTLNWYRA